MVENVWREKSHGIARAACYFTTAENIEILKTYGQVRSTLTLEADSEVRGLP